MAIRSGAGTGVIVSLVVFVLATVFLLVLSIVFYSNNRDLEEEKVKAEATLNEYATTIERGNDAFLSIVSSANDSNQSVCWYLKSNLEERNKMLSGNPDVTNSQLTSLFGTGVSASNPISMVVKDLQVKVQSKQQSLDARKSDLASAHETIALLESQLQKQAQDKDDEVQQVKAQWKGVQDQSKTLSTEARDFFATREKRLNDVREENLNRIQTLTEDVDALRLENVKLENTLAQWRETFDIGRMASADPALLVDGEVIGVGTGNEVFINRGSLDRISLGMKFEIYDSASQLHPNSNGIYPQGKASIEVVKVGETTSTAKIIQSSAGHPIVKDNIIVNPVYDPDYEYSFLVHGNFDGDGDGYPDSSNRFIVDIIKRWGGTVVEDAGALPGDLDFLVLGIAPSKLIHEPGKNASPAMYDEYARQKKEYKEYNSLLEEAQAAKVPVLNANRLFILTGQRVQ